jgi:predicted RNase H-like nuclease (RuvC/YqgF family)
VTELENEIQNIEKTILEKLPNIETIKVNIKSISFDYSIKNSNNKNIKLNQNSIFKLNFLA